MEPRRINLPRETIRHFVAPQGRSVLRSRGRFGASRLHALFSVLRGASVPLVLPRRVMARRRRAGGAGAVGSLDAWKFGFSAQRLFCRALAARSVFCFLFSVLWGGVWGSAPHLSNQRISQSANQPNPLCTFVVLRVLCDSRATSGLIAAKGGGPGFNLCDSSKLPSL